jgi:hypothetical protein
VCCLLVLNLVSSTLPCIRQPRPRLFPNDLYMTCASFKSHAVPHSFYQKFFTNFRTHTLPIQQCCSIPGTRIFSNDVDLTGQRPSAMTCARAHANQGVWLACARKDVFRFFTHVHAPRKWEEKRWRGVGGWRVSATNLSDSPRCRNPVRHAALIHYVQSQQAMSLCTWMKKFHRTTNKISIIFFILYT